MQPTHRHKKRGTEYFLVGFGKMKAARWWLEVRTKDNTGIGAGGHHAMVPVDMREVAIYHLATDPTEIWVRPREEFEDGRFESLPA